MARDPWWSTAREAAWVTAETEYPSAWPAEQLSWATLVSDDDPAATRLALGLAKLQPSHVHLPHRHPDRPEAFYVLDGRALAYLGERTIDIAPGMAIYVPAGQRHALRNTGDVTLIVLWVIGTPPSVDSPDLIWDDLAI